MAYTLMPTLPQNQLEQCTAEQLILSVGKKTVIEIKLKLQFSPKDPEKKASWCLSDYFAQRSCQDLLLLFF